MASVPSSLIDTLRRTTAQMSEPSGHVPDAVRRAEADQLAAGFDDLIATYNRVVDDLVNNPDIAISADEWADACTITVSTLLVLALCQEIPHLRPRAEKWFGLVRAILIVRPRLIADTSPEIIDALLTIHIPPGAYLRSMFNLFWSAIRHPLSETTIDLSTGRVLYRT